MAIRGMRRKVREALNKLVDLGIRSVSLADTVGMAGPDLIRSVFESVTSRIPRLRHRRAPPQRARARLNQKYSPRTTPAAAVLIRPSAGSVDVHSRRTHWLETFLQRCLLAALKQRGVELPVSNALPKVVSLNSLIAADYS